MPSAGASAGSVGGTALDRQPVRHFCEQRVLRLVLEEGPRAEAVLEGAKGVLLGTEDDLWRRLGTGAQGVISALANFIPEEVLELYQKHAAGDEVGGMAFSERLQKARAMTKEYASPAVLKKLAEARHGARMGSVRPPFVPVPADYDPTPALQAVGHGAGR